MVEQLYSKITLNEEKIGKDKITEELGKIVLFLLRNNYWCKIYDDDCGIYVIQFGHNELHDYFGCADLKWVTPEESEEIDYQRRDKEIQIENKIIFYNKIMDLMERKKEGFNEMPTGECDKEELEDIKKEWIYRILEGACKEKNDN